MHQLLAAQYACLKDTRRQLFKTFKGMANADLFEPVAIFNDKSICHLMVHVANCYLHWLVFFDRGYDGIYFDEQGVKTIDDIIAIYKQVDTLADNFLLRRHENFELAFARRNPGSGELLTLSHLQLYTHTITHEFHHKGQILIMRRQLGYAAEDINII